MFARLLAKSSLSPDAPRDAETLPGHIRAVAGVAERLLEDWTDRYLDSLGLDPATFDARLRAALPRAALLHDLGKANEQFQRMVRSGAGSGRQAWWHEYLSVWLVLHHTDLDDWLFGGTADLRHPVLASVVGHHLRFADARDTEPRSGSGALQVRLLASHPDFSATLNTGAHVLHLGQAPVVSDSCLDLLEPSGFVRVMQRWTREAFSYLNQTSEEERRFVAVLKALLVAADAAGSAVPRRGLDPAVWASDALRHVCTRRGLSRVVRARLRSEEPRPFQLIVETSPARVTFVRAGCGSGKTVAAYMWATRRAVGRKLFFCYPTTGTASQGFFDYVPPNLTEAALIHSRSAVDLEDVLSGEPADGGRLVDRLITMGALAAWDAPVTVCTVDTVLGLIQNNRRGLFSFPSLANAAFVFDEIHQYDDQLFGALLRFIAAVPGVPMLLMTASLPRDRLHTLEDVLHEVGDELSVIDGPADLEALERYCVRTDSVADTWSETTVAVGAGRRVLWVANTVDRAVSLAQEAERRGLPTLLYHSRYQYQHRLGHHRVVVDAFSGARKRGVVAVTTQVCEVSLDLSADLLVTELAPVPALIQRLGRLNRRVKPGEHIHPAPAIVTEPPTHEPYTTEELVTARLWLGKVSDRPVSQTALTRAFEDVVSQVAAPVARVRSAWLDCGPFATAAAVREDGTTVPVVRAEDLASLRGLPEGRLAREVVRRTIPMPLARVANAVGMWPRRSGSLVAPAGTMDYSERYGGKWR